MLNKLLKCGMLLDKGKLGLIHIYLLYFDSNLLINIGIKLFGKEGGCSWFYGRIFDFLLLVLQLLLIGGLE
jgi:hypothetical protein